MQVRHVLRPGRSPGEWMIGWAIARQPFGVSEGMFLAGLSLVPLVGPVLMAAVMASRMRLMILTDRRVFLIATGRPIGRMRRGRDVLDIPISALTIRNIKRPGFWRGSDFAFIISGRSGTRPIEVSIRPNARMRSSRRLAAGLEMLSMGQPDPAPGTPYVG